MPGLLRHATDCPRRGLTASCGACAARPLRHHLTHNRRPDVHSCILHTAALNWSPTPGPTPKPMRARVLIRPCKDTGRRLHCRNPHHLFLAAAGGACSQPPRQHPHRARHAARALGSSTDTPYTHCCNGPPNPTAPTQARSSYPHPTNGCARSLLGLHLVIYRNQSHPHMSGMLTCHCASPPRRKQATETANMLWAAWTAWHHPAAARGQDSRPAPVALLSTK